jgi:hypothetical protein
MVVVTEGHECTMMKGAGGTRLWLQGTPPRRGDNGDLGGVPGWTGTALPDPVLADSREGTRSNTVCHYASKLVVALHIDWIIDFL